MGGEKYAHWDEVTTEELLAFFGFMIFMGLVRLPALHDYWKKDEIYNYNPIASRISRDRFFELQRYLHFANNSQLSARGTPGYNKLGKVQPVITSLLIQFEDTYYLHRDVSVDEAMIPFKGRSSMKQYLPLKPVKRGFKVWVLADTNGYVGAFDVYSGKKANAVERGLGANVVLSLTQSLQER